MGNGFHLPGRPPTPDAAERHQLLASPPPPPRRLGLALGLFLLTVFTTLFVGLQLAVHYEQGLPLSAEGLYSAEVLGLVLEDPWLLLHGAPFSLTLLAILLAHELGHTFACRHYGIAASYPYFIPAPTLIGTMGAFIRIRSPIVDRRALFDVGISGPLVGFALAVPALAVGVTLSQTAPGAGAESGVVFGNPPLLWALAKLLRPEVPPDQLFLHPIARAAWVGLFATALNLLPVGQLDGGHIVYALAAGRHRLLSRGFAMGLLAAGLVGWQHPNEIWPGWAFWGVVLLVLGLRHPTVLNPGPQLDRKRRWIAALGLVVFLLCFTPVPLVYQP